MRADNVSVRHGRVGPAPALHATLPIMPHMPDVFDEPPPFLGTWRRVYVAVLVYLALLIAGAYWFTLAWQ